MRSEEEMKKSWDRLTKEHEDFAKSLTWQHNLKLFIKWGIATAILSYLISFL